MRRRLRSGRSVFFAFCMRDQKCHRFLRGRSLKISRWKVRTLREDNNIFLFLVLLSPRTAVAPFVPFVGLSAILNQLDGSFLVSMMVTAKIVVISLYSLIALPDLLDRFRRSERFFRTKEFHHDRIGEVVV